MTNNKAEIFGAVVSNFKYSHTMYGENFYEVMVSIKRKSGVADILPVLVSDRLIDVSEDCTGCLVRIVGQFRSRNENENGKRRLRLYLFARTLEKDPSFKDEVNNTQLDGFICKEPVYRETLSGREICDLMLAVNRAYGKTDYIPLITWGRCARWASRLDVGTRIEIAGRIQSREYKKWISEGETETRVAYEVSCSKISRVAEETANE